MSQESVEFEVSAEDLEEYLESPEGESDLLQFQIGKALENKINCKLIFEAVKKAVAKVMAERFERSDIPGVYFLTHGIESRLDLRVMEITQKVFTKAVQAELECLREEL